MQTSISTWTGSVWQVKGIEGSHLCEVQVKADKDDQTPNVRWAYFNCPIEHLPAYGERITVTFSREVEDA